MANHEKQAGGGAPETELKLALRTEDVESLQARLDRLASPRRDRVDSTYYDTPDLRLARSRAALRLRRIGTGKRARWVQTLKTEGEGGDSALSTRGEWEAALPGAALDLSRFAGAPLPRIFGADAAAEGLRAMFRTVFVRTTWDVSAYGAHIEVALDVGEIRAGTRRAPILEVELELRSGPSTALTSLALDLAGATRRKKKPDLRLMPYGDSKAARGYRLAMGVTAGPIPASRAIADAGSIDGRDGVDAVCRKLVGAALNVVLANADGASGSDDPEYVHQARVALRRMRAVVEILANASDGGREETGLSRAQVGAMRRWARRFGAARDWDVFCSETLPDLRTYGRDAGAGASAAPPEAATSGPWRGVLRRAHGKCEAARNRLRAQIAGPAFAHWALELVHWSAAPPRDSAPLQVVAPAAIGRLLRRFARRGARFSRLSDAERHKLRITAKRLRYVLEAAHAAFPKKAARDTMHALEQFQDAAGRGVDVNVARDAIARLTRSGAVRTEARKWGRARQRDATRLAAHWLRRLADPPIRPRS